MSADTTDRRTDDPRYGMAADPTPMRLRRLAVGVLASCALLLTGAASCDGGPGVPEQGEQGDGSGNGGEQGEEGAPGEGGAGDEVGGGG
jgi:hypothetical protein